MTQQLLSWNDSPSKRTIEAFVARVTAVGSPHFVPPASRIAVFDNDGTLWCEKPMPVEMGFIVERLAAMAQHDTSLRLRQPWKAALDRDYRWLGDVMARHRHGDDSEVKMLVAGILRAFGGMTVDIYQAAATAFLQGTQHPTLKRLLRDCSYLPMIELLRYLDEHDFTNYIASAGDRDFMRVITADIYGIPSERVVGSSNALSYVDDGECGSIAYLAKPDVFDDGPAKPVRIWSRVGRRPLVAFGNSNADIPMLKFAGGPRRPALRMLLQHDDHAREFAYTAGAEQSLELAKTLGWTIVSMKSDWRIVFAAPRATAVAEAVAA